MNDTSEKNIKKSFIDKIRYIWNIRRYTIKFEKSPHNITGSGWNLEWTVVSDSTIIKVLEHIQTEYTFRVLSYDFDNYYKSKIIIKCNKYDKIFIINEFIKLLSEHVRNVKII